MDMINHPIVKPLLKTSVTLSIGSVLAWYIAHDVIKWYVGRDAYNQRWYGDANYGEWWYCKPDYNNDFYQVFSKAADGGDFKSLSSLLAGDKNSDYDIKDCDVDTAAKIALDTAFNKGNSKTVEWLLAQGVRFAEDAVYSAALRGDFKAAKKLLAYNWPIHIHDVFEALLQGNFEAAEWLRDHGGKIPDGTIYRAVKVYGDLKVAEWLVKHGGNMFDYAEIAKDIDFELEKLQSIYVKKSTLERVQRDIYDIIGSRKGFEEVVIKADKFRSVEFLVKNGGEIPDDAVFNEASRGNLDDALKFVKLGGDFDIQQINTLPEFASGNFEFMAELLGHNSRVCDI